MNTLKCQDCRFFDPIKPGRVSKASHGRCVKRSTYPGHQSAGQVFPAGAVREADPKVPAKPFVVEADGVVTTCTLAARK
jgi:hypothetical protein